MPMQLHWRTECTLCGSSQQQHSVTPGHLVCRSSQPAVDRAVNQ
jgi:hypothetical protein